mmetsp:Transcript_116429/g.362668  ORF Transcript_116429/g.362668 Transcript_116429/m.362668 type:complete len:181 (+) Transcript_116429:67-609(+)
MEDRSQLHGSIAGVCYWCIVLLFNDLLYHLGDSNVRAVVAVLPFFPVVSGLALVALPVEEVREHYPFGSKLAPHLQALKRRLASRMPCCGHPVCIALTLLLLGLISLDRASWAKADSAFLGPVERLCGPFSYLWPTFAILAFALSLWSLLTSFLGWVFGLCGLCGGRRRSTSSSGSAKTD